MKFGNKKKHRTNPMAEKLMTQTYLTEEQKQKYLETKVSAKGNSIVFIKNGIRFRIEDDSST